MPKRKNTKQQSNKREVTYPTPACKMYGSNEPPITVELAKTLLGWQEEGKDDFGSDFLLRDSLGTKIRCTNNVTNRELYKAVLATLTQEHLNNRWQLNGEPIIIGRTGLILNGQHTLISLILAAQEWEADKDKWSDLWLKEPTMKKLVVFGISEEDTVVNTMDTCKPRSLANVIYRSAFFVDMNHQDRKQISKITEHAIKLLWHRLGESLNAFAPRKTHAESLDFIARHPKLLQCIKHIFEESESKHIQRCVSPGYAAGLLYLMATSVTDPKEYRETRIESSLDFSRYDKACDFWVLIAGNANEISAIRKIRSKMVDAEWDTPLHRVAVVIKAWNLYAQAKPITEVGIKLKYTEDDEGYRKLSELPITDGIDIGDPNEIDESHVGAKDPTHNEIDDRKKAEISKRKATTKTTEKPSLSKKKVAKKGKAQKLMVGSVRWVCSSGKEPWQGRVVELNLKAARMLVLQGFPGSGNTVLAQLADLQKAQPKPQEAPK